MDSMLASIDSAQFTEWIAYSHLYPFGHENRLLAQIAVGLYNAIRDPNSESIGIEAFLPVVVSEEERKERIMEQGLREAMKRNKERKR